MIEGLNLQAAGIGVDAHGAIVVNDQLRSNRPITFGQWVM